MKHTHDDDRLTAGCLACAERVRIDQRMAEIAAAPLRRCTWTCTYSLPNDDDRDPPHILTFERDVRVPADWTGWDVEAEYAGVAGDAFALSLPSSVLMAWTDHAVMTMGVQNIHIGAIVPEEPTATPEPSPSLFDAHHDPEFTRDVADRWLAQIKETQ